MRYPDIVDVVAEGFAGYSLKKLAESTRGEGYQTGHFDEADGIGCMFLYVLANLVEAALVEASGEGLVMWTG